MADEILADESPAMDDVVPEVVEAPKSKPHLIPDARVKKIVERERAAAFEEGKRHMQEQLQPQLGQMPTGSVAPQQQMQAQVGGMDPSMIEQAIARALQAQQTQLNEHQRLAAEQQSARERAALDEEYRKRVEMSMVSSPENREVLSNFNTAPYEHVKYLATLATDNTGDVMADLAKRPTYLVGLQMLAERDPQKAHDELVKLSKSLKETHSAAIEAAVNPQEEPLGRLKPTTPGVDNGKPSIRDWKRNPKYRF